VSRRRRHVIFLPSFKYQQYFSAYSAFVEFFSQEIATNGVASTLEKYIFDEEANADGRHMLTRVVSGAYVVLFFFTLENHLNHRL